MKFPSRHGPKFIKTVKQATQGQKLIFFMAAKVVSIELIIAISPTYMINLVFTYLFDFSLLALTEGH